MRYLPHTDGERREMLDAIGVPGIDALFADVPPSKLLHGLPALPRVTLRPALSHSSRAAGPISITSRRLSIMSFSAPSS